MVVGSTPERKLKRKYLDLKSYDRGIFNLTDMTPFIRLSFLGMKYSSFDFDTGWSGITPSSQKGCFHLPLCKNFVEFRDSGLSPPTLFTLHPSGVFRGLFQLNIININIALHKSANTIST